MRNSGMVRDLLNHAQESPVVKISGVTQNWPFLNHAVFQRASCHIASDLQFAYQVIRRFPGGKRNHRSRCWVLGEGQRQASISEDVCASKQLRSFTNGTTDGLFRSSHKQSRRLHSRRTCILRRLQSQGASNLRRLNEGSEDAGASRVRPSRPS